MPGPDWMYHPIGAALALFGGLWLLWALFLSGRAKGKPRCPKCWYDMTGAQGLTCPECGKTPKSPRGLLKTRRKYFQALASLLVLLLAYSAWQTPRIKRYGWPCALPNWALIALYPIVDPPTDARMNTGPQRRIYCELRSRLANDRLSRLQRRAVSIIAAHWLDAPEPNPLIYESLDLIASCRIADQSTIELLLRLDADDSKWSWDIALRPLARAGISDSRVRSHVLERVRKNPAIPLYGLLTIAPEGDSDRAAWVDIAAACLERSDPGTWQNTVSPIALLGPSAQRLIPRLREVANEASAIEWITCDVQAAIEVISGRAANNTEYWSRRLLYAPFETCTRQGSYTLMCGSDQWTPETISNVSRLLEQDLTTSFMIGLCVAIERRASYCGELITPLRRALANPSKASTAAEIRRAIDRLEYPW